MWLLFYDRLVLWLFYRWFLECLFEGKGYFLKIVLIVNWYILDIFYLFYWKVGRIKILFGESGLRW